MKKVDPKHYSLCQTKSFYIIIIYRRLPVYHYKLENNKNTTTRVVITIAILSISHYTRDSHE